VAQLVDGGNAERDGRIWVGDRLVSTSAVLLGGESALLTVGGGNQFAHAVDGSAKSSLGRPFH
jgi:hypothetical protein